jgi:hypothetical protein
MGDKTKISNYRPITILSSFSKILDTVTYNQLQEHLNKHGILTEEQFGFTVDSTTNKAMYKLTSLPCHAAPAAVTFQLDCTTYWYFVTCGPRPGPQ